MEALREERVWCVTGAESRAWGNGGCKANKAKPCRARSREARGGKWGVSSSYNRIYIFKRDHFFVISGKSGLEGYVEIGRAVNE